MRQYIISMLFLIALFISNSYAEVVCLDGPHGEPCQLVDTEDEVMSSMQWLANYIDTNQFVVTKPKSANNSIPQQPFKNTTLSTRLMAHKFKLFLSLVIVIILLSLCVLLNKQRKNY